ncbi:MAG: glycosyl transferase, group 1 family protein [Bryobacterales bacterium]|nr:glycosyl transferase, group 1 family protein [Bryobacterales bacterium]
MKIAIFDYVVTANNPAGSCHLQMLRDLCAEHEFTVFSLKFENPCPERIEWIRIPAPGRPLALLFVIYHLLCPLFYWHYRMRRRVRFDLVQVVESNALVGDISYAHFCHAVYLREHWRSSGVRGLRGFFRYIDHKLHALMEPFIYRRVKSLIVPSRGLARELQNEYPWLAGKVTVVPNPVDLEHCRKPPGFDASSFRREHGLDETSFVLVFVALGQFERKGLPVLIDSLAASADPTLQLLVVGGQTNLIADYRRRCARQGLAKQVLFAGMRRDIRPFLWASDAFVLPSSYEVFPLVCLQAAAAGIPLLVSKLNGVDEFLVDRENGFLMRRSHEDVGRTIAAVRALDPSIRESIARRAQKDVERYSTPLFSSAWRGVYQDFAQESHKILKQAA